ncbi:MAG: conjugative transposon protein TraM [Terrimonas sp.]|nr:conjugative transposon protein TraM [Terrimonas sp.]OJY97906.1 MAG: conjugative transposon protein TraM [Sphingobacteriales bacterium 40-81]
METQYSAQFLRKRKMMLVLPLLVLPFITLAFWSLGGGKGKSEDSTLTNKPSGLNLTLPEASFKEEKVPMDKLKFYELADRDSSRLRKLMKEDPYYSLAYEKDTGDFLKTLPEVGTSPFTPSFNEKSLKRPFSASSRPKYADPNEEKVMKKLEALNKAMEQQEVPSGTLSEPATSRFQDPESDKLLSMINQLSNSETNKDPELDQLDKMLDKIITIQNPNSNRTNDQSLENAPNGKSFPRPVHKTNQESAVSLLESTPVDTVISAPIIEPEIGFYGFSDQLSNEETENLSTSIKAVVHEDQTLVNGATIKLRLLQDLHTGSHVVATGQFVYGTVSLNNERLQVEIKSIRSADNILPVKLKLYDIDGMEGIYIPGSIERDVSKQAGGNALQSIDLMNTINPSLEMQAASLGIQTAKSLLSKKVKLVKVHVKAGYQVLLQDQSAIK